MKFQSNSFNSVRLTERTKIATSYFTRGIILINMRELLFLFMTRRLNVLYKYMNISNDYQVIEGTQNIITMIKVK